MREIKFRVWDKNNLKFLDIFELEQNNKFCCNRKLGEKIAFLEPFSSNHIFQQFTGLKDKNGREIYEGDIMEEKWKALGGVKIEQTAVIRNGVYENGDGYKTIGFYQRYVLDLIRKDGESGAGLSPDNKRWKVIGNIYENPKLLNK